MGYFCCDRSRGLNLVFQWSAAWPSWQPLWWGGKSFLNFRSLNLGLYFCVDFPSLYNINKENFRITLSSRKSLFTFFKQINRVCRFDRFLKLAKMFLDYQCPRVCQAFLIFQIFSLLRALNLRSTANIQLANFKIDFLGSQSENPKSLTYFCSLSPTDWQCALCLVVRASRKAGNSV